MKYEIKNTYSGDTYAICADETQYVPDALNKIQDGLADVARPLIEASRFRGKPGQTYLFTPGGIENVTRILLVGTGAPDKIDALSLEQAGGTIAKSLLKSGAETVSILAPDHDAAVHVLAGARLASYTFDKYMTRLKDDQKASVKTFTLVTDDTAAAEAAYLPVEAAVKGTETARDLMNEPPNVLFPASYAERIEALSSLGLEITILGEEEMTKLGMGGLLGVGQGSVKESKLAVMHWKGGGDEAPLALVGKGVCFDTGGISLKPGPKMEDMKGDMGGSAAVVGAMVALASRKAKANVVGLVGLVENMPDGNAIRPGDILTSMSGQTIEVQNTDAEGRLVLCDVLWYAQETYKPKAIIDLATLTGAIITSLGHENAGLFSNNDDLSTQITGAGLSAGETVWRLPLSPKYDNLLKSQFADMKNIGGPAAGSITAAQFLQRFIKDDTPWAHIDIAGVAWKAGDKDATDPGWASGFGPRLLDRFVKDTCEG